MLPDAPGCPWRGDVVPPHPHTRHVPRARLADGTPAASFTSFFGFGFLFFLRSTLDNIGLPQCGASVSSSGPNFQSMNISPTRGNLFFNECVGLPIFFPFLPFPPVSFALVSHPFHISFASSLISFPELFSPTDNHACLGKRRYTYRVYNLFSKQ